jgi:hypothetical protein
MLAGCIYGAIDLQKCFGCCLSETCEIRKNFIPRTTDRGPDAITNDFIYCKGEFDPYKNIRKIEIVRQANGYRTHIVNVRKQLGLD